jgi:dihydropteroate synthase-like protein
MTERLLLLTGHYAYPRLVKLMTGLGPLPFAWRVHDIGVKVAALMTEAIILRRLPRPLEADRIILPGRCRADLVSLSKEIGVACERGPDELADLPAFFGRGGRKSDLSKYEIRIFSEIVDASGLSLDVILARAEAMRKSGADVIDLGCLPAIPFPHLEDAIAALKAEGFAVSVDSAAQDELRRGDRAGADFVLSLSDATLDLATELRATPTLVPAASGDLDGLCRAAERLARLGKPFIADPVLDPIPFGFAPSLVRYAELRRRLPEARILMGIGNVTELVDADTTGMNALLFGVIAELGITDVLTVQVSPHCRRVIREADRARRIMHAAKRLGRLPVGIDASLMALRERKPFTSTATEIAETAAQIRDANFRIEIAADGIHLYNRDQHRVALRAMDLYAGLGVESNGAHAFYLGVELARAEIAWRLGKRYVQDQDLDWHSAAEAAPAAHGAPGPTLPARRQRRRR